MAKTRFAYRHQYDDAADEIERDNTNIHNEEPSMTQQHHAKEADLNEIVRRFGITDGAIPPIATDPRYFGDFRDAPSFREALDRTHEAKERFAALPADLRARFGHDPVRLLDFVQNPENDEESIKLGLLKRQPQETPTVTQPAATPQQPSS